MFLMKAGLRLKNKHDLCEQLEMSEMHLSDHSVQFWVYLFLFIQQYSATLVPSAQRASEYLLFHP